MWAPTCRNSLPTSKRVGRTSNREGTGSTSSGRGCKWHMQAGCRMRGGCLVFGRTGRESGEAMMELGESETEVGKAKGGEGKRTQPEAVVSRMGPLKGRHVVSFGTSTRWHCAASRKVASSIPDGVIFIFH